jgi:hypothetical protein
MRKCWEPLLQTIKFHSETSFGAEDACLSEISGSHGGEYEDDCLVGCGAV